MGIAWFTADPLGLLMLFMSLGLLAGVLAGMFGIGGGLVLVPVLVWVFNELGFAPELLVQMAIGTSLGAIVPTAMLSAYGHYRQAAVDGWAIRRLLAPIILGAILGAALALQLDGRALARVFGLFEIAIALWLLANYRPVAQRVARLWVWWSAGLGIGGLSALIGIAGGTLTTPFLLTQGYAIRRAIGSAAGLGIPIAIAGSLVYALPAILPTPPPVPPWSLGYIYLPAVVGIALGAAISVRLGVWFTHHLPVNTLRRGFALVLILAGVYMVMH